jgi:hypothetical protein
MFFPQICRSSACLVYDLRKVSEEEVARGEVSPKSTIRQRVAEGKSLRFDHSLGSKVIADALQQLIADSAVGQTHADTAGTRSYLVRTFVYDVPGSQRQVVHPTRPVRATTTPCTYTCFVALQDVELNMGPHHVASTQTYGR